MVGRGGRSKACTTCRRRRVKCGKSGLLKCIMQAIDAAKSKICGVLKVLTLLPDQGKPACFNCQRLSLECGGYHDIVFINRGLSNPSSREHTQDPTPSASNASSDPDCDSVVDELLSALSFDGRPTWFCQIPPPKAWTIEVFTLQTLFRGERHSSGLWLPFMLSQTNCSSLASKCFSALAQVAFGRAHHYSPIEDSGERAYGKVLRAVNHNLKDPVLATSTDTVASVAILGVYEASRHLSLSSIPSNAS